MDESLNDSKAAGAPSALNVGLGKDLSKMRDASYLLPPPGGKVVRELIGEIERLQRAAELVAWRHETTCEFISDERLVMYEECENPLRELEKLFCKTLETPFYCTNDAAQWALERIKELEEAREEYAMLKAQFDALTKLYTDAVTSSVPEAGGNMPNV